MANDSEAYFNCCDIDLTWWQFAGGGNSEVDDSDCDEVADEVQNWGTVMVLYRSKVPPGAPFRWDNCDRLRG